MWEKSEKECIHVWRVIWICIAMIYIGNGTSIISIEKEVRKGSLVVIIRNKLVASEVSTKNIFLQVKYQQYIIYVCLILINTLGHVNCTSFQLLPTNQSMCWTHLSKPNPSYPIQAQSKLNLIYIYKISNMYNLIKKFLVTLEVKIIYFVVPLKII